MIQDPVKDALALVNDTSESDRQESQSLRLSMYLDDYENEIDVLLRSQFHKDNYARLYPMLAQYYNTFKKIVNLKSVLYKQEAIRELYKENGNADDDYNELINASNINTTMQLTNKLVNANNTAFVRIIPDIENNVLKYAAVPSELISITQDPNDPTIISSLVHRVCVQDSYEGMKQFDNDNGCSNYTSKYFYWTNEKYIVLDQNRNPIHQENNPDNVNPYGVIPYELFRNMPSISGSIWNETVNQDLYDGTLQVNVLQTYLNNAIKLLGYNQLLFTGVDREEAKKLTHRVSDGLQPIILSSTDASATQLALSNGVTEIRDSIHDIISEIADNHGVSFSSRTSSAQKSSGLALAIEQDQINNIRDEQIPLYRESEDRLAHKSIIIANKDLGYNITENGKFAVNFYEEAPLIAEKDKIMRDQFNLKYNITSVVDLYMENDPDVSGEEEALQRIAKNKEINDELTPTALFDMAEDEDGTEDAE